MKTPLDYSVHQQIKAVLSGVGASVSLLAGAAGDGISTEEWLGAVAALIATYLAVFYVSNGESADPNASTPDVLPRGDVGSYRLGRDTGESALLLILAVVGVVLLVLFLVGVL